MATTTQLVLPARTASPIARWHLLSLDAPTVAVLWTWFIGRTTHVRLPFSALVAMALSVWMLYAADRLLDTRQLGVSAHRQLPDELESRHLFHNQYRRDFLIGIVLTAFVLAALLPNLDPAAIRLYLIEGALLAAWFLILHATHSAHRLPKEIAVGIFFSAAMFIPTIAREPALRLALLPSAILFGALCGLNCLFIYAWEHEGPAAAIARPAHTTTRFAIAHLPTLTVTATIAASVLALHDPVGQRLIPAACGLAAAILLLLDRNRHRLSRTHLRAAADLALLTPILLLPFLLLR